MELYKLEESEEEVIVMVNVGSPEEAGSQQRGSSRSESCLVLNLEKGRSEHFKWTDLEQVQHCTDLRYKVTFPAHTEQGKTGPGLG